MSLNSQPYQLLLVRIGCGGFLLASSRGLLPLNVLAGAPRGLSIGVIIIYAVDVYFQWVVLLLTVRSVGQLYDNLTSNQVGLPAELKHINKRRKRN